mgnify:FL=1
MKRTFLLLVCTVCALLPTSAQKVISAKVAGVVYEALSDSTAKVTGWEHKSTNLSIPSTLKLKGKIRKVVAIAPRAFAKDDQGAITDIVLPKYLVEIGEDAFRGSDIASVEMPNTVKRLGVHAFADCKNLKNVTLSSSLTLIPMGAFSGCEALEELQVPASVKKIADLAFEASGLKEMELPMGVEMVGAGAFFNCQQLEKLAFPNSLKRLGVCCFLYCNKLKSLTLPDQKPRRMQPSVNIDKNLPDDNSLGIKGPALADVRSNSSSSCPHYAVKDILSMTKEYPEFPYNSSPFARQNLRKIVKSFSYFAFDMVNSRMADWQKKKDYETAEQWRERVTSENREKKLNEVISNVRKNFIAAYTTNSLKGTLGVYDTDYGTYPVSIDGLGRIYAKVPAEDADLFKGYWNQIQLVPQYGVIDDQLALLSCKFKLGDKVYQSASSYSNDGSNEFLANLPPLEFDLKGGTAAKKANSQLEVVDNALDINIPVTNEENKKTFAVIIGNENYERVTKVQYALNDAKVFASYCKKTLGLPKDNIRIYRDATYGTMLSALDDIKSIASAFEGDLNVIFYYAGHGVPSESDKTAYLLPVDASGQHTEVCLSTKRLYDTLDGLHAKRVLVFMDACFSGAQRGEGMLASARGVALKVKQDAPKGNMVVFSAATGDETAYPYKEKGHGLFTYYLLKKLQDTKGDVTLGELSDYVNKEVRRQSVVINHKSQSPTVVPAAGMSDWTSIKLK